ncbi:MAG: response regulator transcription factor [Granulosicoccaceae bacterium]|jgi:DNA-binding NarL/FixJ family response regulator
MIIICSPDKTVRQRWRQGLEDTAGIRELDTFEDLERTLKQHNVELVLIHLTLPGLNGVADITALRRNHPGIPFMVFSNIPEENEGISLFAGGVSAYANTYMSPVLLAEAVRVVQLGEIWVGKKLMQRIIANLPRPNPEPDNNNVYNSLSQLTEREREIAALLAEGASNKAIAQQTGVTERTVKSHLTSIFRKTGTTDRLHLALLIHGHAF